MKRNPPPVKPKPPLQRWLVTHKVTGGAIGTVRDQFAFGARRKSGPELHVDVDLSLVVSVGETPADVRELAASLGLRMHEDIVAEAAKVAPETHTVPRPASDIEARLTKVEARVRRTEKQIEALARAMTSRNRIGGRR